MSSQAAHAYAALKATPGVSRRERHLTVDDVKQFHAPPDVVERAAAALSGMGFTVRGRGPLGVSFSGPPELFERSFAARLTEKTYHPLETPAGRGRASASYFVAEPALIVPPHLADVIDFIELAPPVRFF